MTDDSCPIDAFTINAVAQDDFTDVQIPDAPAQPPHTPNTGVERPVSEEIMKKYQKEGKI